MAFEEERSYPEKIREDISNDFGRKPLSTSSLAAIVTEPLLSHPRNKRDDTNKGKWHNSAGHKLYYE